MSEKFKFKDLKTYSSDEWMAGSTKKYRTVFEVAEVNYIWAELSFYNKLFDEKTWTAKIELRAFFIDGSKRKELCKLESEREIAVDENIVFIRDGWGNEQLGSFWWKGAFCWEAYVDGDLIGTANFFVQNFGQVYPGNNPYFAIESIKLLEDGFDFPKEDGRKYMIKFKRSETRYVWVEMHLKNLISEDYKLELFYNYYDEAGQFKAQIKSFDTIEAGNFGRSYSFCEGWGNKVAGSWKDNKYLLEIVFMDTLVAAITFEMGDDFVEGVPEISLSPVPDITVAQKTPEKVQTLDEILIEINQLIGLEDVKKSISKHVDYLKFISLRKEKGFDETDKINLHSVFTGNPGTGKTTIVRLLGKLYKSMNLLSKGHVVEAGRAELVAEYIGQTAPKVKEMIEKARGGILFIDEAYSLVRDKNDNKDFGREVIEIIIKEMSDGNGDIAIMAAGYPKEMSLFIDHNPGLKSRINHYFHFDDYLPEELIRIAEFACEKRKVVLASDAKVFLEKKFVDVYRDRDHTFGNARFAYSVIDEAKVNLGIRIMHDSNASTLPPEKLSLIELSDIQSVFKSRKKSVVDIEIDEPLLQQSLKDINSLIGLSELKEEINDLVKLIRYYREIKRDVLNKLSMHIVFTGNPGTGKTTVARIIGRIFKSLGMLEKGHVVECDREALVAGFIGQTAIKTNEVIEQAKHGVLFIDEAYSLVKDHSNDFGNEAVEVILKRMEDMKGEISVIVAGYPNKMNIFLESNPGLKSRFNQIFNFPDYSSSELLKIALAMLEKESLIPDKTASDWLLNYFNEAYETKDEFFGNARFVRNAIETIVRHQNLRMAEMAADLRTPEAINTILFDDVCDLHISKGAKPAKLGFNKK